MTTRMSEGAYGHPPGTPQEFAEAVRSAPRPATGTDRQAVPEGPGKASGTNRVLGPGSVAGTLCADPTMRFTGQGKAMVKLRLAVAERRQDPESGTWADGDTEFIDVTVWGRQGENAMESVRKGDRVVVNGMWQEDRWFGRDEQWHTRKTLTARDLGPSLMFRQARVIRNEEKSG